MIFRTPTTLSFGTLAVGSLSPLQNVTVRNDGTANLVIGTISVGGTNASQFVKTTPKDFCSGQTLAPSGTCTVGVKFQPTTTGLKNATLQIPSNDPVTNPATVTLSGTGQYDRPDLRPVRQDAPLEPGHGHLEEVDGALGARVDAPMVGRGDDPVEGDRGSGGAEPPQQMRLTRGLRAQQRLEPSEHIRPSRGEHR